MSPQNKYIPSHPKIPNRLDYETASHLARDDNANVRKALADHPDCPPEVLYYLAEDDDIGVRRSVACNVKTPRKADLLLTGDNNPDVRFDLAGKIARVTPNLPEDKRRTVYKLTVDILAALADDQLERVRLILSETLKDMPNAPRDIVKKLASDDIHAVAEPVLKFSPVLTEADLIDIIYSDPVQGALSSISQRSTVTESVADAIVEKGSERDITYLLENPKAAISDKSLDNILERAPEVEDWHKPLTRRPALSSKTVQRLASFVAMNLLDDMQKRLDLDDDTLVILAQAVETRIAEQGKQGEDNNGIDWDSDDAVLTHAQELQKHGKLTADVIEEAFDEGKRQFVVAAVSVLSGLDTAIIAETFGAQRPRRTLAICWKAGLSAHFARLVQVQMGRVRPDRVIGPTDEGDFAFTPNELTGLLKEL